MVDFWCWPIPKSYYSTTPWYNTHDRQLTERLGRGDRGSYQESKFHINYLETKEILLALQSLCNHVQRCQIKVICENTTAVSFIRNTGDTKSIVCDDMTREIQSNLRLRPPFVSDHFSSATSIPKYQKFPSQLTIFEPLVSDHLS